ncbi:MAG: response regulator transcription factor [Chloroflexi bacterium]|nr:response regulator transcription factor [Chloroflexota bacterium]
MNSAPASVFIIEAHPIMRDALCAVITKEPDLKLVEQDKKSVESELMTIPTQPDAILLPFVPDIILLALGNPGRDELEALTILRKSLPDTPILALTTNEVPGQEQAALDAGAQVVLTKTAGRAELLRALRDVAELRTGQKT